MPIISQQKSGWNRLSALVCLVAVICLSMVHGAHLCPQQLTRSHSEGDVFSSAGRSFCPACVAVNSSLTELRFSSASLNAVVRSYSPVVHETPRTPARFFRLFIRPPPSA
jgi:hypothetical protein